MLTLFISTAAWRRDGTGTTSLRCTVPYSLRFKWGAKHFNRGSHDLQRSSNPTLIATSILAKSHSDGALCPGYRALVPLESNRTWGQALKFAALSETINFSFLEA